MSEHAAILRRMAAIRGRPCKGCNACREADAAEAGAAAIERLAALEAAHAIPVKARRPYESAAPDGYLESDRDFFDNNADALLAYLDARLGTP